ncbi:sugar ABC transporter ATPase [Paucilactobacillus hokkaidonensis JCM 18461]|uniref:Sugar ABC transporter ATPase n=2 Tax=Paucilactobacillus hokkaidonensis TaxID=1193095 RepID=A0A0A1GQT1_9LACO|nr:ABC transporter ATP-binding protein [Paucilactobacillus hokkaidonensis]BAP84632.1 sugar ABC transporter ATPase [Paucilactobacillus hokkaidonensis JCM 18461]
MRLNLKDITVSYDQQHNVFEHLNCTVQDGELVALLGPSGSGKTTILNLMAGLLTPTFGQVMFDDRNVTDQDVRTRNIGMVFQDFALYPHLSVLDNIAFPLKMAHVNKANRQKRARELAALVHIDNQLTKSPSELSGGQQQRAAIARALVKNPAVLLLDEPLSNLDAALRIELRDEIQRIQQTTGVTTVFVTHDQNDALRIADKIIVINEGRVQQVGPGTELYRHPRNLFVAQFIGTPSINAIPINEMVSEITASIPADILARAQTVGIRSESILLNPTDEPVLAKLAVTMKQQEQLGRETYTYMHYQNIDLISTAITETIKEPQSMPVYILARGSFLFDQNGLCIWAGDNHD